MVVLEGGLWSQAGFLRIASPQDPAWSYRCELVDRAGADTFSAFTMDEVIDRSGELRCNLLKLDIEGAEQQLFAEGNWLDRVDMVLVEVHSDHALTVINAQTKDKFSSSDCGENLLLVRRE